MAAVNRVDGGATKAEGETEGGEGDEERKPSSCKEKELMEKESVEGDMNSSKVEEESRSFVLMPARHYTRSVLPRLRWTRGLHLQFLRAISRLGGQESATPKSILQAMNVRGLRISHVKSHLQMYRNKISTEIEQGTMDHRVQIMQREMNYPKGASLHHHFTAYESNNNNNFFNHPCYVSPPFFNPVFPPSGGPFQGNSQSHFTYESYGGSPEANVSTNNIPNNHQKWKEPWLASLESSKLNKKMHQIPSNTTNAENLWAHLQRKTRPFSAGHLEEEEEGRRPAKGVSWVNLSCSGSSVGSPIEELELIPLRPSSDYKHNQGKGKMTTLCCAELDLLLCVPPTLKLGAEKNERIAAQEERNHLLSLSSDSYSKSQAFHGEEQNGATETNLLHDDKRELNLDMNISIRSPNCFAEIDQ